MFNQINKLLLFGVCPVVIALGGWILTDYSSRAGNGGQVVADLNSVIDVMPLGRLEAKTEPTLVLFYHPHCPCTAATIRNLERLSNRFSTQPGITAFAFCPNSEPDAWIASSLTERLNRIPGVQVVVDRQAEVSIRFGVMTSGHTLVYDTSGKLLFSGGITPGRGHEGDCLATIDLVQKINGRSELAAHWPVYGCAIVTAEVQKP